ncbi:MAG TPA: DUF6325 family protein [Jatrophihabitantaceae bacterium]|jgi:hypothetical protein
MGALPVSLLDADKIGPVDLAVLVFHGAVPDEVGDEIVDLVHTGTVRVVDLAVVTADADSSEGVDDSSDALAGSGFGELADQRFDLLTNEDLELVKQMLPEHAVGLVVVWENTWAAKLADAIRADGGRVAQLDRIPHDSVREALAAAGQDTPNG